LLSVKEEILEKERLEGKPEKKKKKKTPKPKSTFQAKSANEAIKIMLTERKMSSKINYDVLKTLTSFNVDGSQMEENAANAAGTSLGSMDSSVSSPAEPITVIESGPIIPTNRKRNPSISKEDTQPTVPKKGKHSRKRKPSFSHSAENNAGKNSMKQEEGQSKPALFISNPAVATEPVEVGIIVESGPVIPVSAAADEEESKRFICTQQRMMQTANS